LPDGRLVIGTTGGLVYYDYEARQIEAESEVAVSVTDVAVSWEGEIYVTSAADTGGGLYIFEAGSWQHLTTADGLPTNRMRTLLLDSAGTLWVGGGYFGSGGGLMRFVP
jgi:ligand-binding sensor domain-containing protein